MKRFTSRLLVMLVLLTFTGAAYACSPAIKEKAPPGNVELVLQSQNDAVAFNFDVAPIQIMIRQMPQVAIVTVQSADVSYMEQVQPAISIVAHKGNLTSVKHDVKYSGCERYWCSSTSYCHNSFA